MIDRLLSKGRTKIRLWPIALLRIYTGIFFAYHGFGKLSNDRFTDGMVGFLEGRADSSPEFYRAFIESVVLPNKAIFAGLVGFGELAVGLALILGLATRYAAFAGAFMALNFWLAKGEALLAGSNHDVVWLIILIVLGLIPAGKVAGLDNGLSDRYRLLR